MQNLDLKKNMKVDYLGSGKGLAGGERGKQGRAKKKVSIIKVH
jgi:hypothetical protein